MILAEHICMNFNLADEEAKTLISKYKEYEIVFAPTNIGNVVYKAYRL